MDIKTRLTRKPVTTALWGVLVTAMALFLSVGCALMYSSGSLAGILDDYHTSIAVRTNRGAWDTVTDAGSTRAFEDKTFTQEDVTYFESLDCVESVYFHTFSAAYSPELTPVISAGAYEDCDISYTNVILAGEVTELLPIDEAAEGLIYVCGVVRIEEMIQAHDGYTRRNADSDQYVNFCFYMDAKDADYIQAGENYVFCGTYEPDSYTLQIPGYDVKSPDHPWLYDDGYFECELVDGAIRVIDYQDYSQDGNPPVYGPAFMIHIEGSEEDFLADPDNTLYNQMVEGLYKQHHGVPVMGTDNLEMVYAFASSEAQITAGRSFTEEEYGSGARVCILSETLAKESGIAVGDTITMEQYLCHSDGSFFYYNTSVDRLPDDGMLNNPTIGRFNIRTAYDPAEEFTVVGFYRVRNEWADTSYSFSPNTVFIPKSAQIEGAFGGATMLGDGVEGISSHYSTDENGELIQVTENAYQGTYGIYFSMKLKNGAVTEFEQLMDEDKRFADQFVILDQGFGSIMESLHEVTLSAAKMTGIILACWALLLLLYMLLYQGTQRNNLGIMRSLGASPRTVRSYLFGSGMTVAAAGVVLGAVLTGAVMNVVQNKLFETTFGTAISEYSNAVLSQDAINQMVTGSQLPIWAILAIAAGQLAVFAAVLWLQAGRLATRSPRALLGK